MSVDFPAPFGPSSPTVLAESEQRRVSRMRLPPRSTDSPSSSMTEFIAVDARAWFFESCCRWRTGRPIPKACRDSIRKSCRLRPARYDPRSEEHTSELQSQSNLVCRLLLEKKKEQEPDDG